MTGATHTIRTVLAEAAAKHATTDARGRTTYEFDLAGLEALVATIAAATPRTVLNDEQIDAMINWLDDFRYTDPASRRAVVRTAITVSTPAAPQADAADTRDAARYRWLRDHSEPAICAFYLSVGKAFDGIRFTRATVDDAIDAQIEAMRALSAPTEPAAPPATSGYLACPDFDPKAPILNWSGPAA